MMLLLSLSNHGRRRNDLTRHNGGPTSARCGESLDLLAAAKRTPRGNFAEPSGRNVPETAWGWQEQSSQKHRHRPIAPCWISVGSFRVCSCKCGPALDTQDRRRLLAFRSARRSPERRATKRHERRDAGLGRRHAMDERRVAGRSVGGVARPPVDPAARPRACRFRFRTAPARAMVRSLSVPSAWRKQATGRRTNPRRAARARFRARGARALLKEKRP